MSDAEQMLEDWGQQVYELLDAGATLGEIESEFRTIVAVIREEQSDD